MDFRSDGSRFDSGNSRLGRFFYDDDGGASHSGAGERKARALMRVQSMKPEGAKLPRIPARSSKPDGAKRLRMRMRSTKPEGAKQLRM